MSSRAAPSVRATNEPRRFFGKSVGRLPGDPINRDPPQLDRYDQTRIMVCRRCKLAMTDCEPMIRDGEFWHLAKPHMTRALACPNNGSYFSVTSREVEPFMKKGRRRALRRLGVRA